MSEVPGYDAWKTRAPEDEPGYEHAPECSLCGTNKDVGEIDDAVWLCSACVMDGAAEGRTP